MKAVVTSKIAPLRKEPYFDAELADEVLHGMTLTLVETLPGGWYRAETFYGYDGYIHRDDISNPGLFEEWDSAPKKIINNYSADVLSQPCIRGIMLLNLTKGCVVRSLEDESGADGWAHIQCADGIKGFILKTYLDRYTYPSGRVSIHISGEARLRSSLAETALAYMRAPYRWGGKSPMGIDCSGLCSMAYLLNGIAIYRDAEIKDGFPIKKIALGDIDKGDLIFFPGHVAMYLGEGKYIHSSVFNNGVNINSLCESDGCYLASLRGSITDVGSLFYS